MAATAVVGCVSCGDVATTVVTTVTGTSPEPEPEPDPAWAAPPSIGTTKYVALGAKMLD